MSCGCAERREKIIQAALKASEQVKEIASATIAAAAIVMAKVRADQQPKESN